ncbi:homoserine kinase [Chondrocystis sp. NIES-4102]|nr:homoserine kinase [Chondrocystis sp. NIES-4102]
MDTVKISVPATTANIGVGFDCLGAALTMSNEFQFTVVDADTKLNITVEGEEADRVDRNADNLIYEAFTKLYQQIERTPPKIKIEIKLGVPLSRGLGSSATAIVGGLLGANYLAGEPLSQKEIVEMAIAIEGHPDNVVPAILGNCQLSVKDGDSWQISPIPWHQDIIPVVAIPDFELSTATARGVLPSDYSRSDAIFNISRMGLLIRALATNNQEWLRTALADKLHQPYRQKLITGYEQLQQAAFDAGAYGMVISGAGPTLLSLTASDNVESVIQSMSSAWREMGIKAQVISLALDTVGAKVI